MPGSRKLADLKRELRAVNQAIAALERLKKMRKAIRVTQHHWQAILLLPAGNAVFASGPESRLERGHTRVH